MLDYNKLLSPTVTSLPPSGIRKLFNVVNEMEDVVSLGVGEPDFATPRNVRDMGIRSLEKGNTHYTANAGLKELRMEICRYLERKYNLLYNEDEVFVTVGGSEAIDAALRTIISPGDEILIPEPSFVCYKPLTLLAGGVPVPIATKAENDFRITAEEIKAAVTPKTKAIVLPYPNNPTGAVLERADLESIAAYLKETNILCLTDEIYSELNYTPEGHISIASIEGMRERTIYINGFSKAFAMTGWRLGYVCAPKEIIKPMLKVHQYAIMCSPTTSQYAAMRRGGADLTAALWIFLALAVGLPIWLAGSFAPLAAAVGYGLAAWYGFRQLDGMSGDISGFGLTLGELAGAAVLCFVR